MPITVQVDGLFGGYALENVPKGGVANVQARGFFSSEDKSVYLKRVEGILRYLLAHLSPEKFKEITPIEEMVAILEDNSTATLYLSTIPGDIEKIAHVRSKRGFDAGEAVSLDDIADMESMEFKGVNFPPNSGVAIIFHTGGKGGYFFDMMPLHGDKKPREFDIEQSLGFYFCYLHQQDLFQIEEVEWNFFFDNLWFSFVTLTVNTRQQLVEKAKSQLPLDDLLPTISKEVIGYAEHIRTKIKTHSIFAPHAAILEHALDEYLEGDYISSTAILYSRIEGVMRSIAISTGGGTTQNALATATVYARENVEENSFLILPDKFLAYLLKVYFANFDSSTPAAPSRNSVGHGVAEQARYDQKMATIGLLILDQIFYFLPDEAPVP